MENHNLRSAAAKRNRNTFFILLGIFLLIRLVIIFNVGFIDDEAYHWSWTRHLNYSYFDHPGMVAWIIYPFTKFFGEVAWAVRLPGLFIFLGIIYFTYKLGKDLFDENTGMISAILMFLIPLWGFASLGTMPDHPLGLFWIICAWIFWQSVRPLRSSNDKNWPVKKTWILIGIFMGLGMNSKLTCCLLGLGMGLYLLLSPEHRKHLLTPWPYIGALITFIMMTPVFVWNANHDWASFRYQFLNRHYEAHGADWNRWFQFWGIQWAFMSPVIYFMMLLAVIYSIKKIKDSRWKFIFCLPIPSIALFYYQALMSAYKPHWSGPAYMILLFGAVQLYLKGWRPLFKEKNATIKNLTLITLLPLQLIYIPLITPVIPKIHMAINGPQSEWNPTWDFTNEFYGWLELGNEVKKIQEELTAKTGRKPELGGQRYELIAQLTWATKDQVWQLSRDMTQYWSEQTDDDRKNLLGKDFLIVNNNKYFEDPMNRTKFDACTRQDWIYEREFKFFSGKNPEKIKAHVFHIYHCLNFQGLK